ARAAYNRAVRLGDLGRPEDEAAAYEEVLRRFGPRPPGGGLLPAARAPLSAWLRRLWLRLRGRWG
ncbi:MAG TPA: hypothetical protein VFD01_13410, partial [Candidatus Dormibacteraeota bacterium]|nr:hypothetical protein [Candidatus Dormibacteraeota bacterium]